MTPPDDMVTWLRGVLDGMERLPGQFADYPEAALARVEAERALIEIDNSACDDIARWLAYGHRHDAPGWHQEWTPDSVHTPT